MPKPLYEAKFTESVVFLKPIVKSVRKRAPADYGEAAIMVAKRGQQGALIAEAVFPARSVPAWTQAEGYICMIARRQDG